MEKIAFTIPGASAEGAEKEVSFYVIEQTRLNGRNYLLVTESEEDEAEAYILKDMSDSEEQEAVYEIVEEDGELEAVSGVFAELLDDIDLE